MPALNVQFPLAVKGWAGSPKFMTDISVGKSGNEVRNRVWQDPLWIFNASFGIRDRADVETLLNFFIAVGGKEQSFLVKDYQDFSIPAWTSMSPATGTGALTVFQIVKPYTYSGLGTYNRVIKKPKQLEGVGGVRVQVNGSEIAASAFSFSETTGIVTIPAAPTSGHTVKISCDEFYVPVRFDVDEIPIDMILYALQSGVPRSLSDLPEIPLVEDRTG